jgi:hypothetical protein
MTSPGQSQEMKWADQYHKWVEWSDADGAYLGKCPALITGIHDDDPVVLYRELCETISDVIQHYQAESCPLPEPRVRPMQET